MKLTQEDKKLLKSWGVEEEDFNQIERATKKTIYEIQEKDGTKKITQKEAIEILGREEFLSGISRSAFHWSSVRENGGKKVYFDSSKLFN